MDRMRPSWAVFVVALLALVSLSMAAPASGSERTAIATGASHLADGAHVVRFGPGGHLAGWANRGHRPRPWSVT